MGKSFHRLRSLRKIVKFKSAALFYLKDTEIIRRKFSNFQATEFYWRLNMCYGILSVLTVQRMLHDYSRITWSHTKHTDVRDHFIQQMIASCEGHSDTYYTCGVCNNVDTMINPMVRITPLQGQDIGPWAI